MRKQQVLHDNNFTTSALGTRLKPAMQKIVVATKPQSRPPNKHS